MVGGGGVQEVVGMGGPRGGGVYGSWVWWGKGPGDGGVGGPGGVGEV